MPTTSSKVILSPSRYLTDILFDVADNIIKGEIVAGAYLFALWNQTVQEEGAKIRAALSASGGAATPAH